jgi:hypothetical protein
MSTFIVLATGLLTFSTALLAFISSLRNAHKLTEIHVLVNSNLQAVKDDLATALERIEELDAARKGPPSAA